jgi:hypothetical protein
LAPNAKTLPKADSKTTLAQLSSCEPDLVKIDRLPCPITEIGQQLPETFLDLRVSKVLTKINGIQAPSF